VTIFAVEKQQVLNVMSVCVSIPVLVIRHANRVFPVSYDLPSVACSAVSYFSTVSHACHDFRKKSYRV